VGQAYATIDPLTWSGDAAPGYYNKKSYSQSIGVPGVVRALKSAFRETTVDSSTLQPPAGASSAWNNVCTSTGFNNHFMQATIQVYGAVHYPNDCITLDVAWRTIAYDAMTSAIVDGGSTDTTSSLPAATSKLAENVTIAILVLVCLALVVICGVACGKSGLEFMGVLCRLCFTR